jgi:hypothetical protein
MAQRSGGESMPGPLQRRSGLARLEILLAIAVVALVFQLNPSLFNKLDVRRWSGGAWFAANAILFAILCLFRLVPEFVADARQGPVKRRPTAAERAKTESTAERKQRMKEERELYQRMKDARRRRLW